MRGKSRNKIRHNIVITFVYIIGIVLLVRLFQLQIVHGAEYREESNTRLTRETILKAARGNILDSSGNKLVSTSVGNNVEIYKTKIDTQTLNKSLLLFAQTLEANGDSYTDTFPITINPYSFKQGLDEKMWKTSNKIDENYNAEQCFNYYKEKYEVETDSVEDARRIITIRYTIAQNRYSNKK